MTRQTFKEGLEDVVALNSQICFIDGEEGRLLYHGYDIHDLVEHSTYEEVSYLLLKGELPNRKALDAHVAALAEQRALPQEVLDLVRRQPAGTPPMEVMRTAISTLAAYDPGRTPPGDEASYPSAIRLVAQLPTLLAAVHRLRQGKDPVPPDPSLTLAGNLLYMLRGERASELEERVMDAVLILHGDHELNASTFTARVTAATLSDIYSAITAAISALKGPLHGGANEQVMKMLLEIGEPDKAADWVRARLARKEKIMGFGHRVYRTEDPRATHLRRFSQQLGEAKGQTKWFEMSQLIEATMMEEKGLYPNVDFYSASTYYAMGIPTDLYTPIFACSRVSGWSAHVLEQYANNRLIRPRAQYIGAERRPYVPVDERAG